MKNRIIDVLGHDITDLAALEIHDGPNTDVLGTRTVMLSSAVEWNWTASCHATRSAGLCYEARRRRQ
jgi:hypothetical protein